MCCLQVIYFQRSEICKNKKTVRCYINSYSAAMSDKYVIRVAKREDCPQLLKLIKELAIQSKATDYEDWTAEDLQRDGFDTNPVRFHCFVAEELSSGVLCGHVMYYETYFAWRGKAMRLENLYVHPDHRDQKLATALVTKMAQVAHEGGHFKIDINVFNWNPATKFYAKMGAVDCTIKLDLHAWRIDKDAIAALANKNK